MGEISISRIRTAATHAAGSPAVPNEDRLAARADGRSEKAMTTTTRTPALMLAGLMMTSILAAQTVRTTLADASTRGLVTAEISGTGASSGDSLRVRVAKRAH